MCSGTPSPSSTTSPPDVTSIPDSPGTLPTPNSPPLTVAGNGNSPKRKEREESVEAENNRKKPRNDVPGHEDEGNVPITPSGREDKQDVGDGEDVPTTPGNEEAKPNPAEDEPAGAPADTSDTDDENSVPEAAPAMPTPKPNPFSLPFPSVFPPCHNSSADDEFERCVVHPGESLVNSRHLEGVVDGAANHQSGTVTTTFDQVYSNADTINALRLLTLSLRDAQAFQFGILSRHGTSGVLLYGPPGTGKTMLIRALAKESGARMVAISYADIQSELVGVSEKKVKKLFQYARRHHPCIIFIDEADSCFRSRSAEQTRGYHITFINQFLTEMDGIDAQASNKPIVVAATNRPFDIDEGVLRRLGRRILVDVPDARGREAILRLHLEGERLDPDLDLTEVARHTHDFTGSDIRDLTFQAALAAVQEIHDENPEDDDGVQREKRSGAERVIARRHFLLARKCVAPAPKSDLVAKIREFHNRHGTVGRG